MGVYRRRRCSWRDMIPTRLALRAKRLPFQGRAIAYAALDGCARTRPRGSRRDASGAPHHEGLLLCRNTRRHPEEPAKGGRLEGWATGRFFPNAIALPLKGGRLGRGQPQTPLLVERHDPHPLCSASKATSPFQGWALASSRRSRACCRRAAARCRDRRSRTVRRALPRTTPPPRARAASRCASRASCRDRRAARCRRESAC